MVTPKCLAQHSQVVGVQRVKKMSELISEKAERVPGWGAVFFLTPQSLRKKQGGLAGPGRPALGIYFQLAQWSPIAPSSVRKWKGPPSPPCLPSFLPSFLPLLGIAGPSLPREFQGFGLLAQIS